MGYIFIDMSKIPYLSSQHHRDQDIVNAKAAAGDFVVEYVEATIDGDTVRIVVDGHHAYDAAKATGNDQEFVVCDWMQDELDKKGADWFLAEYQVDTEYHNIETGQFYW